jgi:hypothetical protein
MTNDFFIRVRKHTEGKEKYGCIMAQAVSHHPHTMEDHAHSQASPFRTCGGKSGTMISFSLSTFVVLVSLFHQGSILLFFLLCCCVILTVDSVFK